MDTLIKAPEKKKFESGYDYSPRAFILHDSFDWKEFCRRVDLVSPNLTLVDLIWPFSKLFVKWQCDKMSFGVLKQKKEWDVNPFQWGVEDLASGETIYRAPFEIFEQLLKIPLLNSDGVLINRAGDKKQQLRDAYKSIGTNFKHFPCKVRNLVATLIIPKICPHVKLEILWQP